MKYGKFVDAAGSVAFQLRYLSKAVSTDETRFFMMYIHIEPSDKGEGLLGVATDGRRLHLVDPLDEAAAGVFGITPGYWQVFKGAHSSRLWLARLEDSETESWRYPAWRNVMPKGEVAYKTTFEGFNIKGPKSNYTELAKFLHDFPDATAIDLEYLSLLGTGFTWDVEWYGSNKSLKFIEGNRLALIQPMMID
jgi:hypothetical protein